jgi:hypothetical protein
VDLLKKENPTQGSTPKKKHSSLLNTHLDDIILSKVFVFFFGILWSTNFYNEHQFIFHNAINCDSNEEVANYVNNNNNKSLCRRGRAYTTYD